MVQPTTQIQFSTWKHTFTSENRGQQHLGMSILLISNNSNNTWHKLGIISRVSFCNLGRPLRFQVDMFFFFTIAILFTYFLQKSTSARTLTFDCFSSTSLSTAQRSEDRRMTWLNGSTRSARVLYPIHLSLKFSILPMRWKSATGYRRHSWLCTRESRSF